VRPKLAISIVRVSSKIQLFQCFELIFSAALVLDPAADLGGHPDCTFPDSCAEA
jgi:hypothetical protein